MTRPTYSFVVPIFRDGALAEDFCAEFESVFRTYLGADDISGGVELIFVNDDGTPETAGVLRKTCERYPFSRLINLSRNFGQHVALTCGYEHAQGDYVGMLNVDMEDPPDQIPVLLAELEKGEHDIVLGVREKRESPLLDRMTSKSFTWVLNKATGYELPLNTATLRIMNRRFLDAYLRLSERNRYLPGLEMWLGFQRAYVPIRHARRRQGKSSYSLRRRLAMSFEAIISFSDLPLRFMAALGGLVAMAGFAIGLYLVFGKLFLVDFRAGYASTIAAIVFTGGVLIAVVGVASLYIGRILAEVQGRPLYLIRDSYNVPRLEGFDPPSRDVLHTVPDELQH